MPDYTVEQYVRDLRAIRNTGAATAETSFYPPIDRLFNAAGATLKPKVLFSTQLRNQGAGMPDGGFFPQARRSHRNAEPQPLQNPERGVVEIKPPTYSLDALAREPQTLGYLQQYGLVLITNLREFRLLHRDPSGQSSVLERYTLATSADDLWHRHIDPKHNELLPDFLRRVMLYKAPLTDPKDVAWLLASYAREARARAEDHPLASFETVKQALQESLGIQFEGEKGDHFFRSTLVQTLFYGIFSAWILWHRSPEGRLPNARFDWRVSAHYLRVPVLRQLFNAIADPGPLNAVQITEVLNLAGEALNRVQPVFFETFQTEQAVAYFYEPFLEAFDPELRKELGVWYTPREIVHYMVERVDQLLRTELAQPLGLASANVRILDPCCGTGAYLTAVLHRIHRTMLEQAGDDNALVPHRLREAALTRVFGFEIMPAPFVIAHMELASLLETAGAPLSGDNRAGVYLTNALTGWVPMAHPQTVIFPEMEQEREASENIKQHGTILVILGNPPYNGYAGIAQIEEERDLTNAYRSPVEGLPAPQGQGLNELYVRFFRVAERRIARNLDGRGIVSFISNYSWLDGLSHPTMRYQYLQTFPEIFIDNLNGDKYRTGKTTPEGLPDPSVFSTPQNREGIQVGTAIATLVRTPASVSGSIHYRNLWGAGKLAQLESESRLEATPTYETLQPATALGLPLAQREHSSEYTSWPRLPELFPMSFSGIKTARDSFLVSIERDSLIERMAEYYDSDISDSELASRYPIIMKDVPRYNAKAIRHQLIAYREAEMRLANQDGIVHQRDTLLRNLATAGTEHYYYRPFDLRWLYYEHKTKLLDERREDYWDAHLRVPSMISAQANRRDYDPPVVTQSLASYHVIERASLILPLKYHAATAPGLSEEVLNLSHQILEANIHHSNPEDFFFHALAIMHTSRYRSDNAGALLGDWPRIPLPATSDLLSHSATLGRRLAELLDPESTVTFDQGWKFIARLSLPQPLDLDENLKIIAGWGHYGQGGSIMPGRGLSNNRPWTETECSGLHTVADSLSLTLDQVLEVLGETCFDVRLNGAAFWSSIPANVWEYTLGGYQVLKKWLSYREYSVLARPLHAEEAEYFSTVVRRISAILLLGPALDKSYVNLLPTATGLPARS